jgi:N-methylhydantoinase A
MARTIRSITIERGRDPREFTLVAFGGAGPLHAAELASLLDVSQVLIPPHPGITSAAGLLTSDLRYDLMRTVFMLEGEIDAAAINAQLDELAAELHERLVRDGANRAEIQTERFLECRYVGQGYELRIPVGADGFAVSQLQQFHAVHEAEYGRAHPDPIEVVNLRVTATGRRPRLTRVKLGSRRPDDARLGEARTIWRVDGELVELPTRHLLREQLPLDEPVAAPAIIFQRDTTIVVPPGWSAVATTSGPLLLSAQPGSDNGDRRVR